MSTTNTAAQEHTTIYAGGTHVQANSVQFVHYHGPESQDVDELVAKVAASALYDTAQIEDPAKCHPGTREAILRRLLGALDGRSADPDKPFVWLHGAAGAGKSAIARTLCEQLHADKQLLASFFFFRASPERNNTARLISTLTYQFRTTIPQLRPHIKRYIRHNPLIFTQSLDTQARHLLIDPICRLHKEGKLSNTPPTAIVIDGLDECEGTENRRNVLHILHTLQSELPFPITILVASRPNREIEAVFKDPPFEGHAIEELLNNERNVDADILKFYTDSFARIEKFHVRSRYFTRADGAWPALAVLNLLIKKTSGQFIFAKTVIRFVEPDRSDPEERLQVVMGALPALHYHPFQQLDAVYKIILSIIEPDQLQMTLTIIGLFLCDYSQIRPQAPSFCGDFEEYPTPRRDSSLVEWILDLKAGLCSQFLVGLEALFTLTPGGQMQIYHKSFSDFLFDSSRAGEFYIAQDILYEGILRSFIKHRFYHPSFRVRRFMLTNMELLFTKARITPELLSAIGSVDFVQSDAIIRQSEQPLEFAESWLRVFDLFMRSLLNSHIPNKEGTALPLLASLRIVATDRLKPYINNPTLWPLLYIATRNDPPQPSVRQHLLLVIPYIPPDLLKLEQTSGYHFSMAESDDRADNCSVLHKSEGPLLEAAGLALPWQYRSSDDYTTTLLIQLVDQCIKGAIEPSFLVSSKLLCNILPATDAHEILWSKLDVFLDMFKDDMDVLTSTKIRRYGRRVKKQRVRARRPRDRAEQAPWDCMDPNPILHRLTDDWDRLEEIIEAEPVLLDPLTSSLVRRSARLSPSFLYPISIVAIVGLVLYRKSLSN